MTIVLIIYVCCAYDLTSKSIGLNLLEYFALFLCLSVGNEESLVQPNEQKETQNLCITWCYMVLPLQPQRILISKLVMEMVRMTTYAYPIRLRCILHVRSYEQNMHLTSGSICSKSRNIFCILQMYRNVFSLLVRNKYCCAGLNTVLTLKPFPEMVVPLFLLRVFFIDFALVAIVQFVGRHFRIEKNGSLALYNEYE